MLFDEAAVRANIRNRDGKRVFFLSKNDTITPSARDWLRGQRIEILPASQAKIAAFQLPNGKTTPEKPEHMTHLRDNILVPKNHPVIAFRGAMDTLQAEILLAQPQVAPQIRPQLEEILSLCRHILRWEVMEEPANQTLLCGLSPEQIRKHSHHPEQFYGQPHFMPHYSDGPALLQLNKARCAARSAELAAIHAFHQKTGVYTREDILMLLNRISSMLYILMIQIKAEEKQGGQHGSNPHS